jgi:hypothetical protein
MNMDTLTSVIASLFAAMIAFGLVGDRRNHGMADWAILAVVRLATCGLAAGVAAEVWRSIWWFVHGA